MNPNLDIKSTSETEATLSIGDVVTATGIGEATLRAWERRFGFPEPRREPSGHRRYSAADVERIRAALASGRNDTTEPSAQRYAFSPSNTSCA